MRKPKPVHMPTYMRDRCNLALAYAEDGAYHSAADVLRDLSAAIYKHAHEINKAMDAATPRRIPQ